VVLADVRGLDFACARLRADGSDAGRDAGRDDAAGRDVGASDGGEASIYRWERQQIAAHPNDGRLGDQLALLITPAGDPWVAARRLDDRATLVFHRRDGEWVREILRIRRGGIDPHLLFADDHVLLSIGSDESDRAPTLWLLRRNGDDDWQRLALMHRYDEVPGRYHDLRTNGEIVEFCAYSLGSNTIDWSLRSIQFPSLDGGFIDAGLGAEAGVVDAAYPAPLARINGGPFCALDPLGDGLWIGRGAAQNIVHFQLPDHFEATELHGPFTLFRQRDSSWIGAVHDGVLVIAAPGRRGFRIGRSPAQRRPRLAASRDAITVLLDADDADRLGVEVWEVAN
jgi:hypothetical protein